MLSAAVMRRHGRFRLDWVNVSTILFLLVLPLILRSLWPIQPSPHVWNETVIAVPATSLDGMRVVPFIKM
jgi:hypothetical protein